MRRGLSATAALTGPDNIGTLARLEDVEATRLMLEALFDIKVRVIEIHEVLFGGEDDDEEETEEDA